jgi:hypothetical protein
MLSNQLLDSVRYVVNEQGQRTAVQLDMETWEMIRHLLGDVDEVEAEVGRFLSLDVSQWTAAQQQAYAQAKQAIQNGRQSNEPRILGLFSGLIEISDDFDAPLPDEAAFWGEETDEYGMTNTP